MHDHDHPHDHSHSHEHNPGNTHDHGHAHEQDGHCHHHDHAHTHGHHHAHGHGRLQTHEQGTVLVLRPYTGVSGDIMVAGLARMLEADQALLDEMVTAIGLGALHGALSVHPHALDGIGGWQCRVNLPQEHSHRTLTDIRTILHASMLTDNAKELAKKAFAILAEAEGAVHGKLPDDVAFHEVGALDSILDICLAAALFDRLAPALFVCGPLPVCDGAVRCAHGIIPVPAPAVMRLLHDIPVQGIPSSGETLTPTGVALLKAFGASFGAWPRLTIKREALVYGTRIFPAVPNGAIFAFGEPC